MGFWSFYFLAKLAVYAVGAINLNWWLNALFAIGLMLWPARAQRLRNVGATLVAVGLLWHESWLPAPEQALHALRQVQSFSAEYWAELALRLFSWRGAMLWACGAAMYLWIVRRVRLGPVALVGLLMVPLLPTPNLAQQSGTAGAEVRSTPLDDPALAFSAPAGPALFAADRSALGEGQHAGIEPASNAVLDRALADFYAQQEGLNVNLPVASNGAPPFDLVILSVCSLSWRDLMHTGLNDAPFLRRLDVLFRRFNTAASYSGPAVMRLIRGTCGHVPESTLMEPAPPSCQLLGRLERAGFETGMWLNHDGHFDGFADRIQAVGGLRSVRPGPRHLPVAMTSFDGSDIRDDYAVLHEWSSQAPARDGRRALLYNTVSLHDGNRLLDGDGRSSLMTWKTRAAKLFGDLDRWLQEVDRSGRPTVVVLVPEHGAGLLGDADQFPGLRELPSPSITHVPAGLILLGLGDEVAKERVSPVKQLVVVEQPSSYAALFAAVSVVMSNPRRPHDALSSFAEHLPASPWVAENQQLVVMHRGGRTHLRDRNKGWREMAVDAR